MKLFVSVMITAAVLLFSINIYAAQINIGKKPADFGSTGQAIAIQHLMISYPGDKSYNISYETDTDAVVFGIDLNKDVILRLHSTPDGHGTSEQWDGDVLFRIKSAADGGSLNNTPSGKRPGSFGSF